MQRVMRPLVLGLAIAISSAPAIALNAVELQLEQPLSIPAKFKSSVFIVQMKGDPVAIYEGGTGNYKSTKPAKGKKLNPNSAVVKKYVRYLDSRHDLVINAIGAGEKIYDYRFGLNGFAAVMTEAQAQAARQRDDVLQVWADELKQPATDSTHEYLGLSTPGGVWETHGKGEDVIVGVLDTGVWPEHPSFSDQVDFSDGAGSSGKRNLAYGPAPADWYGSCQSGERWSQDDCNNKLIGARYFHAGYGKGSSGILKSDFLSARDSDGHGSHTSGTAVGNEGVINSLNELPVSGMAPRARLAVYKVCWEAAGGAGGCASSDSAAAIDTAIADGVDVINFSIGGPSTVFAGPEDIEFLIAANNGVWVATSNGNSGPVAQTTGTPAGVPWITAVGATSDNEVFALSLDVTGDLNDSYFALEGAGDVKFTANITGDMVSADPHDGCTALNNDIAGQIALVIRGTCAFTDKYNNAQAAGASAIIVYNDGADANRIDPITMSAPGTGIPGAMIGFHDGDAINSAASVTGLIGPDTKVSQDNRIAGFSSRGPNGGAPDVIKPDLVAPGVGIIAGETPEPNANASGGTLWQSINGTSMSSPHVAGVFALLREAHPDWSAAMGKSAMMTSARQNLKKTIGEEDADPFDIGAGFIVPGSAFEPGLVYDAGFFDYLAFTCDNNVQLVSDASCDFLVSLGFPTDGSDLNLASIAVADLVGSQTVTRTVTSVTAGTTTFNVSYEAPTGVDVVITPSQLVLEEGDSAEYQVTFTANANAVPGNWSFGSLTWNNDAGVSSARSPIAIKTVQLDAPAEVSAAGVSGTLSFDIGFGYAGDYSATASGLVSATKELGIVADDPTNSFAFFGPGTTLHTVVLPADTDVARWALFNEYTSGNDDLDLYVFHCPGNLCTFVGSSGAGDSNESVTLTAPADGLYAIFVHGWQTDGGLDASYTLFNWISGDDAGNSTVSAPTTAILGGTDTVSVNWNGLTAGEKYLGAVVHADANGTIGHTVVSISTE